MLKINKIHCGDTRELLKQLPDKSVNCCVTSPPYFRLRDYGTATWSGGDFKCDHVESEIRTGQDLEKLSKKYRGGGKKQGKISSLTYKTICQKCGAIRIDKQIGLESTPEEFVNNLVELFREVKRVLKDDGTLWLNLGDSYMGDSYNAGRNGGHAGGDKQNHSKYPQRSGCNVFGLKPKDLVGIPWRVALGLQADGWWLRQDIIWAKPNPMPESVTDRCTKSHEYIFLLSKSAKYYYDNNAIKEKANYDGRKDTVHKGSVKYIDNSHLNNQNAQSLSTKPREMWKEIDGVKVRNKRSVWFVPTKSFKKAHFATFPTKLIEPCILAGCPKDGVVLDPFMGAGTTAFVARENNRNFIGFELNPEYIKIANQRILQAQPQLF
jgi:DNA modification methylase